MQALAAQLDVAAERVIGERIAACAAVAHNPHNLNAALTMRPPASVRLMLDRGRD
jgi:hypothetical protein